MANQRFSDLVKKPNAPFTSASMDMGDFIVAKTKDAVNFDASFKGHGSQHLRLSRLRSYAYVSTASIRVNTIVLRRTS